MRHEVREFLGSSACLCFADCQRFSESQMRRTMSFHWTAITPLTRCLSPRVQSKILALFPRLTPSCTIETVPLAVKNLFMAWQMGCATRGATILLESLSGGVAGHHVRTTETDAKHRSLSVQSKFLQLCKWI